MSSATARTAGCLVLAFVLLVAGGVGAFVWLRQGLSAPVPGQQRCVATAGGQSVVLDLDQAHFASIVVGLSVRRALAPRAASIAMATVYQETGIRNLDYGDRDSVGLFQQRPSQGWGPASQLMDPYYATGKFYDALVKIKGWEAGDITEVAQKIQRSGYPEAYRDHEADARVLASTLTGRSPGGLSCLEREQSPGRAGPMITALQRTFGPVSDTSAAAVTTIKAKNPTLAWAYAHFAVANAKAYGVTQVVVGDRRWQVDGLNLAPWLPRDPALAPTRVEITVRG